MNLAKEMAKKMVEFQDNNFREMMMSENIDITGLSIEELKNTMDENGYELTQHDSGNITEYILTKHGNKLSKFASRVTDGKIEISKVIKLKKEE